MKKFIKDYDGSIVPVGPLDDRYHDTRNSVDLNSIGEILFNLQRRISELENPEQPDESDNEPIKQQNGNFCVAYGCTKMAKVRGTKCKIHRKKSKQKRSIR